jgi:hypothetical protein
MRHPENDAVTLISQTLGNLQKGWKEKAYENILSFDL